MKKAFFFLLISTLFLGGCIYGPSIIPIENGKYLVQVYGQMATFNQARKALKEQATTKCPDFSIEHESRRVVDPWDGVDEFQWIIQCPK